MQDPLIGQQIERYIIRHLVGSGGMAQVYRAYDTRLDREVALKILAASMQRQPAFAERFLHEGRTLAQFNHPTIVPIYTVGQHQGRPYMVQELLTGPTLEAELAADARPTPSAIQAIIDDVADALDYAHARGVIHRDLKPGNLMRNRYGQMVLMDFGIAKAIAGTEKLTQTGMVLGTPHYLAPEQARGGTLTPAADIYALGVILFELLTGQVPFDDPSPLVVAIAHLNEPPPAPRTLRPDLPPAVEAVVLQALAKAPEARFNHAGVLATALRSAWSASDDLISTLDPSVVAGSMPHGRSPIPTPITPAPGAMRRQVPTAQPQLRHAADAPPAVAPAVRIPAPAITLPAWLRHPAWRTDRRLHVGLGVGILLILLVLLIRRDPAAPSVPLAASGVSTAQGSVAAPVVDFAGPIVIADALTAAPWHTQQESHGSMRYAGSRYQLQIPAGINTFWSLAPRAVTIPTQNSVLTVMVTPNQGKAGLVFGFRSLQDHYRLLTQADGTFFLERRQGTAITTIASGSGAGAGRLGLVLRGTTVRAYFNDTLLHEQTLDAPLQGSVGVIVVTPEAGDAVFETLTVRSAP